MGKQNMIMHDQVQMLFMRGVLKLGGPGLFHCQIKCNLYEYIKWYEVSGLSENMKQG